jgi:perosamine synthetase
MELIPQFRSFVDLSDYEYLRPVFEERYLAEGRFAQEFHDKLLQLIGAPYGCLASNGTLALYLALKALGIGPGDEVIVQNVTFIASANAVSMTGATPRFADVKAFNDLTVDLERLPLTPKTRAVMACHLFGTACSNIEELRAFCTARDLLLIEDAAQALGIKNEQAHCGTFGAVGTFSFYADKTITTGEGGFVVTRDADVYERMLYLRNQGRKASGTFVHPALGYNFRMNNILAALGLSQLVKMQNISSQKKQIDQQYRRYLSDAVDYLVIREDFDYIPFRVVVFVPDAAESVMAHMKERGIEARSMFYPLHRQPCYGEHGYRDQEFEHSMACFRRGLCLPTWVGLTEEQIRYVSETLKDALVNATAGGVR